MGVGILDLIKRGWTLVGVKRPWPAGTSIHAHLAAHTTEDGELEPAGFALSPDDAGALQWAPGARDGILAHHMGASGTDDEKVAMLNALIPLLREANAAHLTALYTQCTRGQLAGYVDGLVDALNDTPDLDAARVHELGMVLATEAPHLEAVKLGISLLGMVEHDDREVLLQLGLHDELTMFVALALVKQIEDSEPVLFSLAKRVHGWGRIHTVWRLADTQSAEIKAWMLRDGFRNTVMNEYLAHVCASTGELHRALAAPDDALRAGAAELLRALAAGGPAEDLADYEHTTKTLEAWLPLVKPDLVELAALDALRERKEVAAKLKKRIEGLRTNAAARAAIDAGLESDDTTTFGLADAAAQKRGIDTFARHEAHVHAKTDLTYSVFRMMQEAKANTVERALAAAASVADLEEAEQRLVFVLQELPRFSPGTGAPFVITALRSSWVQARVLAARVLGVWGAAEWSAELREALEAAVEREDDDDAKAGMERVLAGRSYEATAPMLH